MEISTPETAAPTRGGLTAAEVTARRAEHGWNELPRPETVSPLTILLRQFASVLILILAVWLQLVPGATVFGEKAPWQRPARPSD